jgi:hypothetical protein
VRRRLAVTALSIALVAGTFAATSAERASASTAASRAAQGCILGICIGPSSSPSPTSSASSPAPDPLPLPTVSLPVPTALPSVGASPGNPLGLVSPSSSASGKAKGGKQKSTSADPGLVASSATEVLTAGSATMTRLAYQGNVSVPLAGGGSVEMMKFTADLIGLASGVTDTVTQARGTTVTSSPTLTFSGGVTLYATRLSGSLAGVPVSFTPTTVDAVLLTLANLITGSASVTFTNVTTDQPIVLAGMLQTGTLSIS